MMSKDSTKFQFHRKEIFNQWLSLMFVVPHAQSINDSFVL